MIFQETPLRKSYVIQLDPKIDFRGFFVRMFCKDAFKKIGFEKEFVQINYAGNMHKYTFRGFHFQHPPFCETKLIKCVSGKVQDYIIDLRKGSSTYLQNFTLELSENDFQMLLVPEGFAHGYLTLEDNSNLIYFHTEFFKPGFDDGLRFNDPVLKIKLPEIPEIISEKDIKYSFVEESNFAGLKL